jgi:hypothetical protein
LPSQKLRLRLPVFNCHSVSISLKPARHPVATPVPVPHRSDRDTLPEPRPHAGADGDIRSAGDGELVACQANDASPACGSMRGTALTSACV